MWMSPYLLPLRLALEDLHASIKKTLTLQHLKYILSVTIDCNVIMLLEWKISLGSLIPFALRTIAS